MHPLLMKSRMDTNGDGVVDALDEANTSRTETTTDNASSLLMKSRWIPMVME